jgi:membrane protease YdiL (CAAX protease family)
MLAARVGHGRDRRATVSLPVAGWYPDPYRPGQIRLWDGGKWTPYAAGVPVGSGYAPAPDVWRRLDRQMAGMRAQSDAPWGVRPILMPIVAFVAVVGSGLLLTHLWTPRGPFHYTVSLLLTVAGYAVMAAAVWYAGRPIARRYGGWAATFGWARPTLRDAVPVGPWLLANMAARLIVGVVVLTAVPGWRHVHASNVNLNGRPASVVVEAILVVVLIAPPIEELMFRGLILRTLMRRLRFWPAAISSSLLFGLFHTYELATLAGVVLLGLSTAVFGLGQCLLVRRHVRLNAAIAVHSLSNLVAALLSLVVLAHT